MCLKHFNYSQQGLYFLTICTKDRRCLLSQIVGTGVLDCPNLILTDYGKIVDRYINQMSVFYDFLSVERYVIMPNHVHLLLHVFENGQSRTPVPTSESEKCEEQSERSLLCYVPASESEKCEGQSERSLLCYVPTSESEKCERVLESPDITNVNSVVSSFVSSLKRFCNREYGRNIWQSRFFDHIIRNEKDYEEHIRYIYENPIRWHLDELYSDDPF